MTRTVTGWSPLYFSRAFRLCSSSRPRGGNIAGRVYGGARRLVLTALLLEPLLVPPVSGLLCFAAPNLKMPRRSARLRQEPGAVYRLKDGPWQARARTHCCIGRIQAYSQIHAVADAPEGGGPLIPKPKRTKTSADSAAARGADVPHLFFAASDATNATGKVSTRARMQKTTAQVPVARLRHLCLGHAGVKSPSQSIRAHTHTHIHTRTHVRTYTHIVVPALAGRAGASRRIAHCFQKSKRKQKKLA